MNISCALWKAFYLGVSVDLGFQVRAPELEVPRGALGGFASNRVLHSLSGKPRVLQHQGRKQVTKAQSS